MVSPNSYPLYRKNQSMNNQGLKTWRIGLTIIILVGIGGLLAVANWADAQQMAQLVQETNSAPTFSPPSGQYAQNVTVTLAHPADHANIIFTTDGSVPQEETAAVYETPIVLRKDAPGATVLRARAVMPDGRLSDTVTATYIVGMNTSLPIVSIAMDVDAQWQEYLDKNQALMMSGRAWERPVQVTYFDKNGRIVFDVGAGLRLHGQASRLFDKKSYRLYFRDEYGPRRLNVPLFAGNPIASFDNLVLHNGGQDSSSYAANWTLLRTNIMSHLARETKAIGTYNQPTLLFFNGDLMGVFNLRERMNEEFFQDHFGLKGAEIVDSLYRNEEESAATDDWRTLQTYAETHDLADPDHYAYVQTQLDINNMIDHYILQMYGANTDWPHFNERVVRANDPLGKWYHVLWDVDYNFGMFPASSIDQNMVTWVMRSERPEVYTYTGLFRALMENPQFRNQFLVRSADLYNTVLYPDNVLQVVDTLAEEMRPDIGYEIARWSSPGNWEQSVLELQQFATERPAIVRQHYLEGFGLKGTAELTVAASDNGTVLLNETWYPERPFTGTYFQDTTIQLRAIPDAGFHLAGWTIDGNWVAADNPLFTHKLSQNVSISPTFQPNEEDAPRVGDVSFTGYSIDGWQTGVVCENSEPWLQFRLNETTDLRGWRLTDNDSPTGDAEGSLIFADIPELSQVPKGTNIKIVLPTTAIGHPTDDLQTNLFDKEMTLYATNAHLDGEQDLGFHVAAGDAVVLLAPTTDDEQAITMVPLGNRDNDLLAAWFGLPETAVSHLAAQYCP